MGDELFEGSSPTLDVNPYATRTLKHEIPAINPGTPHPRKNNTPTGNPCTVEPSMPQLKHPPLQTVPNIRRTIEHRTNTPSNTRRTIRRKSLLHTYLVNEQTIRGYTSPHKPLPGRLRFRRAHVRARASVYREANLTALAMLWRCKLNRSNNMYAIGTTVRSRATGVMGTVIGHDIIRMQVRTAIGLIQYWHWRDCVAI